MYNFYSHLQILDLQNEHFKIQNTNIPSMWLVLAQLN